MSTLVEETQVVDIPTINEWEARRREVLLRAAELIETEGWTKGANGMVPGGPYCMVGAVAHVLGVQADLHGGYSYDKAEDLIGQPGAWLWNDWHLGDNGQSTVARALRRLANGVSWEEAIS